MAIPYHINPLDRLFATRVTIRAHVPASITSGWTALIQDRRLSRGTYIVHLAALRHLYHVTLNRPGRLDALPIKNREHKLPVVLSREEVRLILAAVTNLKHKALIMVAYDSGLRVSELRHLWVNRHR